MGAILTREWARFRLTKTAWYILDEITRHILGKVACAHPVSGLRRYVGGTRPQSDRPKDESSHPVLWRRGCFCLTEEDESDFLTDLVCSVLIGDRIENIDIIFSVDNTTTVSPMGSLTAVSPRVVPVMTLDEWMASQGISDGRIKVRQRRRKPVAAEDQMTLF
ncbi:MAG: hypothetical protein ABIG63_19825 [Chloroflexota bacterium]